jgi:hypothetical protein
MSGDPSGANGQKRHRLTNPSEMALIAGHIGSFDPTPSRFFN